MKTLNSIASNHPSIKLHLAYIKDHSLSGPGLHFLRGKVVGAIDVLVDLGRISYAQRQKAWAEFMEIS